MMGVCQPRLATLWPPSGGCKLPHSSGGCIHANPVACTCAKNRHSDTPERRNEGSAVEQHRREIHYPMLTLDDDANSGEAARGVLNGMGVRVVARWDSARRPPTLITPCPLGMMGATERLQQQRQAGQHLRTASQHTRNTTNGEISSPVSPMTREAHPTGWRRRKGCCSGLAAGPRRTGESHASRRKQHIRNRSQHPRSPQRARVHR